MKKYKLSKYNILVGLNEEAKLLYNSRNNNLIKIETEKYFNYIKNLNNGSLVNEEHFKSLYKMGYIIDEDRDETGEVLLRFEENKYRTDSLNLTLALTNTCNLDCKFCYVDKKENITISPIVKEGIINFINQYHDSYNLKRLFVTWSGGEPLTAFHEIVDLSKTFLEFCHKMGIEYSSNLISNGILLNKKNFQKLVELKLKNIQISMDANSEVDAINRPFKDSRTSSFEKVYSNIIENAGTIPILIRIALSISNRDFVVPFVKQLKKDNLLDKDKKVHFAIGPLHMVIKKQTEILNDILDAREYADTYFTIHEQLFNEGIIDGVPFPSFERECGAYKINVFSIDARGDIFKCFENVFDREERVGSVFDNFGQINYKYTSWTLYDFDFKNMECYHCKFLPVCKGGCNMVRRFVNTSPIGHYIKMGCPEWKYEYQRGFRLYYRCSKRQMEKNSE